MTLTLIGKKYPPSRGTYYRPLEDSAYALVIFEHLLSDCGDGLHRPYGLRKCDKSEFEMLAKIHNVEA